MYVATSEFEDGAARQAEALGADPAVVFVEHPIQDRTDEEMQSIADRAADALISALVVTS